MSNCIGLWGQVQKGKTGGAQGIVVDWVWQAPGDILFGIVEKKTVGMFQGGLVHVLF